MQGGSYISKFVSFYEAKPFSIFNADSFVYFNGIMQHQLFCYILICLAFCQEQGQWAFTKNWHFGSNIG